MSAIGVPTMTEQEVAVWEQRLRSGSLFDHGQPRYSYWRPVCSCGHREGRHGYRDGIGAAHYGGACKSTRCACEAFQETTE